MSDQKIEIEISTLATGAGAQQTTAEIQRLKAEAMSVAPKIQGSAVPALEDYTKGIEKLGEAAKSACASEQRLNDAIVALPILSKTLHDPPPVSPAEKPSQINAIADALERIAAASETAAENTGKLRMNLEAAAKQYALLSHLDPEGAPVLDSKGQSRLATQRQTIVPAPTPTARVLGETPDIRAVIERAQAETAAVGRAWAEAMVQLRAYIDSQAGAIAARQQNQIQ